jgi:hypothetical protein
MHDTLGPGHTIDFGELVDAGEPIQAVVLEDVCAVSIDDQDYGILRCIGITRPELEYARQQSVSSLLERLVEANVYPHTDTRRDSVLWASIPKKTGQNYLSGLPKRSGHRRFVSKAGTWLKPMRVRASKNK